MSPGLGKGSEFLVKLPARPANHPGTEDQSNEVRNQNEDMLPCHRILVVDDNIDSARSMAMVLKRLWKQSTEVAHDGLEALEMAEEYLPHAILLDIGLPGMSGYEVASRLRSRKHFTQTILIAMTGLGQDDDIRTSLDSGFNYHLVKPVDLDALKGMLATLADRNNQTA